MNEKNKKKTINSIEIKICDVNNEDSTINFKISDEKDIEDDLSNIGFFITNTTEENIGSVQSSPLPSPPSPPFENLENITSPQQLFSILNSGGYLMLPSQQLPSFISLRILQTSHVESILQGLSLEKKKMNSKICENNSSSSSLLLSGSNLSNLPFISFLFWKKHSLSQSIQPISTLIPLCQFCDYCSKISIHINQIVSLILFNGCESSTSSLTDCLGSLHYMIQSKVQSCCPLLQSIPVLYSPPNSFQSQHLSNFHITDASVFDSKDIILPFLSNEIIFKNSDVIEEIWNEVEKVCQDMKSITGILFLFYIIIIR